MALSTDNQLNMLMDLNHLSYEPPLDGSLANSRQLKKYLFASGGAYAPSQQPQIQVNSGADAISGPTSFILMDVKIEGTEAKWNTTAATDVKCGSAFNLIREFQISHISGEVMDRTDHLNALVAELVAFMFEASYADKYGQVFGYGSSADLSAAGFKSYALPLFLCSGLFAQTALIPPMLLAGAKIKIQLESARLAVVTGADDAKYAITDMNLVLDSIDLYDAVKKSLLTQAGNTATQGLQYPYYSWFQLRKSENTQQLNFDMNYSCAKAMTLLVKTRTEEKANDANAGKNSMGSDGYNFINWRTRIGSMPMPEHDVSSPAEAYVIAMEASKANPNCDLSEQKRSHVGVSYSQYESKVDGKSRGVVVQSLEQNAIDGLNSGIITNNARLLNFRSGLNALAADKTRVVDAYIKHLRVANVMINNVVIDK